MRGYLEPDDFKLETTTVWSFVDRGSWATHSGKYRGNWSPYVPRNLILRYSQPNDWILDQFLGSGTTLVEAKLLGRNAVGVDINPHAIKVAKNSLNFNFDSKSKIFIKEGNATNLEFLKDSKIDFICMHPPYANIINYSKKIKGDISRLDIDDFLNKMKLVAKESYRILKKGKYCALMMGDLRRKGKIFPLGFHVMNCFIEEGFLLKEIIIKKQHNCFSDEFWKYQNNKFLLIAHEYIFVFEK